MDALVRSEEEGRGWVVPLHLYDPLFGVPDSRGVIFGGGEVI